MNNIDKVIYINLEHRIDRNEEIINEFKKMVTNRRVSTAPIQS